MSHERDDDYVEIRAWPVAELVGQLVERVAMARRGLIEDDVDGDVFERETDRFELDAWARIELAAWLLPGDAEILEAPAGNLENRQGERCHDALIEASSIGWSLRLTGDGPLPVFTHGQPELDVLAWAPGPWTPVRNALKGARLRSDDELARERERWELLYWRLILPSPLDPDAAAALAETVDEIREADLLPTADDDLLTDDGTSFSTLDTERRTVFAHEAALRLRALNWVCGFGGRLDSTPLIDDDQPNPGVSP